MNCKLNCLDLIINRGGIKRLSSFSLVCESGCIPPLTSDTVKSAHLQIWDEHLEQEFCSIVWNLITPDITQFVPLRHWFSAMSPAVICKICVIVCSACVSQTYWVSDKDWVLTYLWIYFLLGTALRNVYCCGRMQDWTSYVYFNV